jgi:hypothetical protein
MFGGMFPEIGQAPIADGRPDRPDRPAVRAVLDVIEGRGLHRLRTLRNRCGRNAEPVGPGAEASTNAA